MAVGKPLNKNSYYGASQGGQTPDIDMTNQFQGDDSSHTQPETKKQVAQQQVTQEENTGVQDQEEQQEITEQATQSVEQVTPEQVTPEQVSQEQKTKEYNFKAMREAKEKVEKERDELVSYFMALQKQQNQNAAPTKPNVPEQDNSLDNFNIDEDSLLDGRYGKKVANELKQLKEELKNYKNQSAQQTTENRIKNQFPDFDNVVSADNIAALKQQYPEIAQSLHETQDLYSKAVSAYGIIKKFGIFQDPSILKKHQQIQQNTEKPKPLSSLSPQEGESPLQKANIFAQGLTPALKDQLRREMYEARKRI